jgi:phage-related protein
VAVSNEVYRATLELETKNLATSVQGLTQLAEAAQNATQALERLSSVKFELDFGNIGLDKLEKETQSSLDRIVGQFKDLKNKITGHSIIPDMISEIETEFSKLDDRTSPHIQQLAEQFEKLKRTATAAGKTIADENRDSIMDVQNMLKQVFVETGRYSAEELDAAFKKVNANVKDTGTAIETVAGELINFRDKVREAGAATRESFDEDPLEQLGQRWQSVTNIAGESLRGLDRPLVNVREGIRLAFADGGNFALGFRQTIFGLQDSTNIFARSLGFIGGRFNELSRAQSAFAKEALRINDAMQKFTSSMVDQIDVIKETAKAEGVQKAALSEIDGQVKRLEKSYKDMHTTIEATGKPTIQQMSRIKLETQLLEQRYRALIDQGIIPAGSATEKMIDEMVQGAKRAGVSNEQMVARLKVLSKEVDKAERKQREKNKTDEKSVNIFKRVSLSIGSLLKVTRQTTNEINHMEGEMRDLGAATSRTNQALSTAKGAFAGFVGAAVAITGLRYAFDSLRFVIGGIAREFYEVNTVAQNFEITLQSMLRGTGLEAAGEVQAAVGGALDFIKEAVAETPFELADAMESFQRLIVAGLDPQAWLTPIADAAAIMQKPMDQLIGSFQRLVVGDTGQALAMMRDFGINVNVASALVNTATGELLSFDEAAKLANATTQELSEKGVERISLEFEKSGQLATETGLALKVLNGYMTQNAAIAGTAAARSQSLSGVISNLKDFVSNLFIEMGKPVIQTFTDAGVNLLSVLDRFKPTLSVLATQFGARLAVAVSNAVTFITEFRERFGGIIETVQQVVAFVASIFSGDWGGAWTIFSNAVADGLDTVSQLLDSFVDVAFDWGVSFIIELANGIIDAAGSFLMDALNYVGDLVSSFLAPGSAPEEGPLSTIDEWGQKLMEMFGAGVQELDTGNLERALEDMHRLAALSGTTLSQEFVDAFSSIDYKAAGHAARKQFDEFMDSLGEFDITQVIGGLEASDIDFIGQSLEPIKDFLLESLGKEGLDPFLKIRETMATLVAEMGTTGEVNEELWGQIEQTLGEQNKELLGLVRAQLELEAVKKKVADATAEGFIPAELKEELAQAEEKVEQEEMLAAWQEETNALQEEFLGGLDEVAKAMDAAAGAAGRTAKARKKEIETLEDWYARERALIEEKYELGVLSEKEYIQALLTLEKQYVDRALKEGVPAGLQAHADAIIELEARLEALKKTTGEAARGIDFPTPEELLAPFAEGREEAAGIFEEIGQQAGFGFMQAFRDEIPRTVPEVMSAVWASLSQGLGDIFDRLKNFVQENVTPENFAVFSLISGAIASIAVSPVLGFIARLAGGLLGASGAGGGLLGTLVGLSGTLLKFSVVGAVLVTVLLNWENIIAVIGPLVSDLMGTLRTFGETVLAGIVERLGGAEAATSIFHDALAKLSEIGTIVVDAIFAIPNMILSGDWQGIGNLLLGLLTGVFEFVRSSLLPIVGSIFGSIADAIYQALPPGIKTAIEDIRVSLAAFFEEGRLGGELLNLLGSLRDLFVQMIPIFEAVGIVVGVVAGTIGIVLFSALESLVQVLPFIERAFAGVVRVVSGIVDVITGFVTLLQAAWAALTGDSEKAGTLLQAGLDKIGEGFGKVWSGILETVTGLGGAILAFITALPVNIVKNVAAVLPDTVTVFGQNFQQIADNLVTTKDQVLAIFLSILDQAVDIMVSLGAQMGQIVSQWGANLVRDLTVFVDTIVGFFVDLYNQLVGGSIIPEMVDGVLTEIVRLKDTFVQYISDLILGVAQEALKFIKIGLQFVDSIQTGIGNAWEGLNNFVTGKVEELFGPILDTMSKIPGLLDPSQLKEAGENMVGGVRDGIEGTWGSVASFFGDKSQELQQPVQETSDGIVGIFDNMRVAVVGGSIVPEMATAIITNITTMSTTLAANVTTFSNTWLRIWTTTADRTIRAWQNMVETVVELAQRMYEILEDILSQIIQLFHDWEEAIQAVTDELENLPEALEVIGNYIDTIKSIADEFDDWGETIDKVNEKMEDLVSYLEQVKDLESHVAGVSTSVGGGPAAQKGVWRVAGTSGWTLHAGETVLPSDVAANFRALVSSLRSTGIGAQNLTIPAMGTPAAAANVETSTQTYVFGDGAFAGAFPNVRSGRDARGFVDQLDELTDRAALRGSVVGA